jgi:hypothetical protein
MDNDKDYPYIRKWDRMMGSDGGYTTMQLKLARETNAPQNAIYRKGARSPGSALWATTDDITSEDVRKDLGLPPLPPKRRAEIILSNAEWHRQEAERLETQARELLNG